MFEFVGGMIVGFTLGACFMAVVMILGGFDTDDAKGKQEGTHNG